MKDEIIKLRVSTNEKEGFKAAADACGLSLSKWLVKVATEQIGGEHGNRQEPVASEVRGLLGGVLDAGEADTVPVVQDSEPEPYLYAGRAHHGECPLCDGRGWNPHRGVKEPCVRCKGTGKV